MTNSLSRRQREFVRQYMVDLNGSAAAVRAGYAEQSARQQAHRLMTNANVRAAIDAARPMRIPDGDEIIRDLQALKDRCMELDETGKPRDASTACRALELLGRFRQLWTTDQGATTRVSINIVK